MTGIGCDHAGYELKLEIIKYFKAKNIDFLDLGCHSADPSDYPVNARKVCEAVLCGQCINAVLICGTGIGISIAANRIKGIRAALCGDVFSAKASRRHNDANILALGGRVLGAGHAIEIVKAFLETVFSGEENHIRRIGMIDGE